MQAGEGACGRLKLNRRGAKRGDASGVLPLSAAAPVGAANESRLREAGRRESSPCARFESTASQRSTASSIETPHRSAIRTTDSGRRSSARASLTVGSEAERGGVLMSTEASSQSTEGVVGMGVGRRTAVAVGSETSSQGSLVHGIGVPLREIPRLSPASSNVGLDMPGIGVDLRLPGILGAAFQFGVTSGAGRDGRWTILFDLLSVSRFELVVRMTTFKWQPRASIRREVLLSLVTVSTKVKRWASG